MALIYNKNRKKGLFYIPAGAFGPSVSAAFGYSKSSFNQAEADPTPTITGTAGGSFNASAGLVFVDTGTFNSSTGQIDLSASTIDSHIITYTVDGVQSGQTVGITAAPYSSTRSFSFDGVNDYISVDGLSNVLINESFSLSLWFKGTGQHTTANSSNMLFSAHGSGTSNVLRIGIAKSSGGIFFAATGSSGGVVGSADYDDSNWYHLVITKPHVSGGAAGTVYINGSPIGSTETFNINFESATHYSIGQEYDPTLSPGDFFKGNIDELSIWNTILTSDAVTEIHNSGAPNSLTSLTHASSSNLVAWYKMGE